MKSLLIRGRASGREISSFVEKDYFISFPYLPHDIYRVVKLMPTIKVRRGVALPASFADNLDNKPHPQKEFLQRDNGEATLNWGAEEWWRYRSYYLDLIEEVDQHLGTILDSLRRRPDADNTIVVYSSDHGDMGGAHGLPFKGPFMYEEMLRVPLVVSWPRRFPNALSSDSMVSGVDLAPTLASMAGIEWLRPLPGKDFSSLFDHPEAAIRQHVFAEYYGKQHWVNPIRTIPTAHWKYNVYVAPGRELARELYDLQGDPGEIHNLADSPDGLIVQRQLADDSPSMAASHPRLVIVIKPQKMRESDAPTPPTPQLSLWRSSSPS